MSCVLQGFVKTGTLGGTLSNIKWATDYFLKCIISDTVVVGQVGNGNQDHALWTRPEDIPDPVPVRGESFFLTASAARIFSKPARSNIC